MVDEAAEGKRGSSENDIVAERIKELAEDPKYSEVKDALLLLSSALRYHIREKRAKWWPHYERCEADILELVDDSEVVVVQSCEVTNWGKIGRQKNLRRTLTISADNCNPQDVFEDGDEVFLIFDNPPPNSEVQTSGLRWYTGGTVEIADDGSFSVVEKSSTDSSDSQYSDIPVAVIPGPPLRAEAIEKQLLSLGNEVLERVTPGLQLFDDSVWCDLLLKRIPRQQSNGLPHSDDPIKDVVKALRDSKNSYVAVQGPPGSGKTYLGAHVIAQLAKLGWKIGVVAQSHKTVENLLRNLVDFEVPIGKKNKTGDVTNHSWTVKDLYKFMADQSSGFVVGGTAWTFAAKFRENGLQLDLLVIDEAGQFSLAHTISAGSLAKRVLLLGDPQQLAQVSQAAHEAPIDNSALSHLLDGRATISDEFGYFLKTTHRMHPAVTRVISRLQYERRLKSHPRTAERLLEGINPGIHLVQVDHYDCTTSSLEEATKVAEIVKDLLGRDWHDFDSDGTPTQKQIDQTNILVVAAYNSQVRLIRRVLAEAGLDEVQVGTVDKFQGAEQPVVIASLAASSFENLPRGLEFLISPNRINVALSRARWASYLVFSGELRGASPVSVSTLLNFGSFLGVLEESQR